MALKAPSGRSNKLDRVEFQCPWRGHKLEPAPIEVRNAKMPDLVGRICHDCGCMVWALDEKQDQPTVVPATVIPKLMRAHILACQHPDREHEGRCPIEWPPRIRCADACPHCGRKCEMPWPCPDHPDAETEWA